MCTDFMHKANTVSYTHLDVYKRQSIKEEYLKPKMKNKSAYSSNQNEYTY